MTIETKGLISNGWFVIVGVASAGVINSAAPLSSPFFELLLVLWSDSYNIFVRDARSCVDSYWVVLPSN